MIIQHCLAHKLNVVKSDKSSMICWRLSSKKDYMFQLGVIFYLLLIVCSLLLGNILVESNAKKHHKGTHLNIKQTFGNLN
jgi:hypothetical protein